MQRFRFHTAWLSLCLGSSLLLAIESLAAQPQANNAASPTPAANSAMKKHTVKKAKKAPVSEPVQEQQAAVPQPPPPPPTLAQQAPVAPQVTYTNGLLSINAPNCSLGDVLSAVRAKLGITVEGGSGLSDRIVVNLGPGQPREVLTALLSGSRFNYVLLGSATNPGSLQKLIISGARQGDLSAQAPVQAASAPKPAPVMGRPVQPPPSNPPDVDQDVDDTPDREPTNDANDAARQSPEPQPDRSNQPNPSNVGGQPQQQGQQDQNQPKTPDQLFRELQQLQQQQLGQGQQQQ